MKIEASQESRDLILKSFSAINMAGAEGLKMLVHLLPFINQYDLKNGLGMLTIIISNLARVNSRLNSNSIRITEESLESVFETGWINFCNTSGSLEISTLTQEHLVFDIPEQRERIGALLLADLLDEFETMSEFDIIEADIPVILMSLRDQICEDICAHFQRLRGAILTRPVNVDYKTYYGPKGVSKINAIETAMLSSVMDSSESVIFVNSYEQEIEEFKEGTPKVQFYTGIKLLDDAGVGKTHTFVSIDGFESSGKTKFSCFIVDEAMSQGVKAAVFANEMTASKILNEIKSHAFYRTQGNRQVTWNEMADSDLIDDIKLRAELGLFKSTFYEKFGSIGIMNKTTVSTLRADLQKAIDTGVTLIILDGIAFMPHGEWRPASKGKDPKTATIEEISAIIVEFKKEYPITVLTTNWTRTTGGLELGTTSNIDSSRDGANSSATSQLADINIALGKSKHLGNTLRIIELRKQRETNLTFTKAIVDTALACSHFEYIPEIQHLLKGDAI